MKTVSAIVQARCASRRLPNKVISSLEGRTMIEYLLERLNRSRHVSEIIVAITDDASDDVLADILERARIRYIRGETEDVLGRYVKAAQVADNQVLVRITGDCPLIDPVLVDKCIEEYFRQGVDYLSNALQPTFPDGLDTEVFSKETLYKADKEAAGKSDREHVTTWIRSSGKYNVGMLVGEVDWSHIRLTVDEEEDLVVIRKIAAEFKGDSSYSWEEIIDLYEKKPAIFSANRHFRRNEGATLCDGQKLWRRAKKVIPGGSMLLSKRAEMFLPGRWPAYFESTKGCDVIDISGNTYKDMSIMGVGTNLLGYSHEEVDCAVRGVIEAGNMCTLNCYEEVLLAERLIDLHEWSEMVRFARSGGEANAIAVRIARAATGREKVAICGYHGWHDWYMATNLENKSGLSEHLLEGLNPRGVPKSLAGTTIPFSYNRLDQIESIVRDNDLAAIKMEVQRSEAPAEGFLERIREICTRKGIILIFDECSSGFRETFGGLHLKYGVYPDLAMFGKTLGNGYAISAVIGKKEVMEAAQDTFISSTFWTERIGPVAALKTLEVMERVKSWEMVTKIGGEICDGWEKLAKDRGIGLMINGIKALAGFRIEGDRHLEYKTYIVQEMLKEGYLASDRCYACLSHENEIGKYLTALGRVFDVIEECEDGRNINELLEGPICHSGFQRLN